VTESKRTSLLLSRLRKAKPDSMTQKFSGLMAGGWPDALHVGPRYPAWIEFKRCEPGQNPHRFLTALQSETLAKLHALGQVVYVCALHENGEQSMWCYGESMPVAVGKDAFLSEMAPC
jgi:hypothetical protein